MKFLKSNWKTQIDILCIGQAVLMITLAMSLPFWPLYVAQLGDFSPSEVRFWSGAIYAAPFISSIFFSPIWGKYADNHGHKSMILRTCLGLFMTQSLIIVVTDVFWIFIIRLLQGALAGFIAAAQAWALSFSPEKSRSIVIGKLQSSIAVGNLFGPFLGGLIATYSGYRTIFLLSSVICLVMLCLFYFILQDTPSSFQNTKIKKESKSFRSLSILQKNIVILLLVIIFTQAAQSMVTPVFALFITEKLGGSELTIGLLSAASGLMMLLSAPLIGRFLDSLKNTRISIPSFLIGLLLLGGLIQVLNAYNTSLLIVFLLRLMWGICLGGIAPILTRIIVENTEQNHRGLAIGFGNSGNRLGVLTGIILGVIIETKFGYTTNFLLNSALYFISASLILVQIKTLYPQYERISLERQTS